MTDTPSSTMKHVETAFDPFEADFTEDDTIDDLAFFHNAVSHVSESGTSTEGQSNPWSSSTWMSNENEDGSKNNNGAVKKNVNISSSSGYTREMSGNESSEGTSFRSAGDDGFGSGSFFDNSFHQRPSNADQNNSCNKNTAQYGIHTASFNDNSVTSFDLGTNTPNTTEKQHHQKLKQQQSQQRQTQQLPQKHKQQKQQQQKQQQKQQQQKQQQKQQHTQQQHTQQQHTQQQHTQQQHTQQQQTQQHPQQQHQHQHQQKKGLLDENIYKGNHGSDRKTSEPSSSPVLSPPPPSAVEPLFPEDPMESISSPSMISNPYDEIPVDITSTLTTSMTSASPITTAEKPQQQSQQKLKDQLHKLQQQLRQQQQQLPPMVEFSIREQLITLYDDVLNHATCEVQGCIHVKTSIPIKDPFWVRIQDKPNKLASLEELPSVSHYISKDISHEGKTKELDEGDRILRVSLPQNQLFLESPIANYACSPHLRPIPMLIKSRAQVTKELSRVGFKIRANPSNTYPLTDMVILMAIPPFVRGDTVKMSRKDGIWDEMKRTIIWRQDILQKGEVVEVQAQFEFIDKDNNQNEASTVAKKFPLLVQCSLTDFLFSEINIDASYTDDFSIPLKATITRSTQILHRKI